MMHLPGDFGHIISSHTPALVPDWGSETRVMQAAALDMAERRARATVIVADVTPTRLPSRVVVPRGIRREQGV